MSKENTKFKLRPRNKYAWIKFIDQEDKVGSLYTAPNSTAKYRLATILGIDEECHEGQGFKVGQVVLCDVLGTEVHRIGMSSYTTCLIRNFISIVEEIGSEES